MIKIIILGVVVILGYCSNAEHLEQHDRFVDGMVKRLIEVDEDDFFLDPPINRWAYLDGVVTIGNRVYTRVNTESIEWEGIEKLHRSSPTIGSLCRCLTQTVDRVDLTVPSGFNLTAANMAFYVHDDLAGNEQNAKQVKAKFAALWKDPKVDAIFRLKKIKYSGGEAIQLDEVMTNVDKSNFQMFLTCKHPDEQHLCDDLMKNYMNTWDFDLHKWIQDTLQSAIASVEYDFYPKK